MGVKIKATGESKLDDSLSTDNRTLRTKYCKLRHAGPGKVTRVQWKSKTLEPTGGQEYFYSPWTGC